MMPRILTLTALMTLTLAACGGPDNTRDPAGVRLVVVRGPAVIEEGFRCAEGLVPLYNGGDFVICGQESERDMATAMGLRGDIDGLEGDEATIDIPSSPTFSQHITPILDQHCWSCHHPEITETLPLNTYEDVTLYGDDVRAALLAGTAPHRLLDIDGDCNTFEGLRQITPDEIGTYMRWVDIGMPQGDPALAVEPAPLPTIAPDLVVMAPEHVIEAHQSRCFLLPTEIPRASFVTGYRAIPPDAQTEVLAMVVDAGTAADMARLDAADEAPGWDCAANPPPGTARGIAGWVRGLDVVEFPAGTGVPIDPSQRVIMVVNTRRASTEPLRAGFELQLSDEALRPGRIFSMDDLGFLISAGQERAATYMEVSFEELQLHDATAIAGLMPRIWERGVAIHAEIIADRERTCLADAPQIEFQNWSSPYFLSDPLPIAATDRIILECVFDTTADTSPVAWGFNPQSDICAMVLYVLE